MHRYSLIRLIPFLCILSFFSVRSITILSHVISLLTDLPVSNHYVQFNRTGLTLRILVKKTPSAEEKANDRVCCFSLVIGIGIHFTPRACAGAVYSATVSVFMRLVRDALRISYF
jgi:hypothetical protein